MARSVRSLCASLLCQSVCLILGFGVELVLELTDLRVELLQRVQVDQLTRKGNAITDRQREHAEFPVFHCGKGRA